MKYMNHAGIIIAALLPVWTPKTMALAAININNYGPSANPVFFLPGILLPEEGAYVEIYAHINNQWAVITPEHPGQFGIPLTAPGYFDGGLGTVPGTPDYGSIEFELRAWIGQTTYEAANLIGSVRWTQNTGSWDMTSSKAIDGDLKNPPLYFILPEPSSIILGFLGGAGLLLHRRKARR